MTHHFTGKHILHGNQFSRQDLEEVLSMAKEFETKFSKGEILPLMQGRILATLFFEPSTRTRLSFEAAMHRLQGAVVSVASAETSMIPKTTLQLDEKLSLQVLRLMDRLEELDDVQRVYCNVDFPEELLESYGG